MATTKAPAKAARPARPRATVRKRSGAAPSAGSRARRTTPRKIPIEHLGHPSSAVVVTGGASGIGEACARALAEVGRPVAVWDLDGDRAIEVAAQCARRNKVKAIGLSCDVTLTGGLARTIELSREVVGPIGGLVHAAGVSGPAQITDMDEATWDQVLDVNLRAGALLTQALADELKTAPPGAAICYVSSIEAFFGHDFLPAYASSKAGLLGLTRSACATLGPFGIRVNSVCPGAVITPMLQPMLDIEGVQADLERRTPLGRLAQPDDIARTVRFLLSDEARYVSGTQLIVDGGLTAVSGI